ncbi:MAG: cobalamin biosynthesis protein CbiM, partial [Victivallales bacterium]|nr:cobalamin biosynthesis protein CbiM [Victivallales bacterium]
MHMADALLSPVVGGAMWAATGTAMGYSARRIGKDMDVRKTPLMGVLGAFVFAAQMINFTIPGTGSSGHLGGGMLLAILLGPYASFLVMASILTVQALLFADGGLLALGCNIFNLGAVPSFIVYPLICRPLLGRTATPGRLTGAGVVSAVLALQLGALGVVLETCLSGVSELPFMSFLAVMLPIHLAIGLVEGVVTAAVVNFVWKAEPGIISLRMDRTPAAGKLKPVMVGLLAVAALTGVIVSWCASQYPDGLEWSVAKITGSEEVEHEATSVHAALASFQEKTAILPDYGFR